MNNFGLVRLHTNVSLPDVRPDYGFWTWRVPVVPF